GPAGDRGVPKREHAHVAAGADPLNRLPDVRLHARGFIDHDEHTTMKPLKPNTLVGRKTQRIVPWTDPEFGLAELREGDPARLHNPMNLAPEDLLDLRPARRRGDDDAVGVADDEPEHRGRRAEGLAASVTRLDRDARSRRDSTQDGLLRRPKV